MSVQMDGAESAVGSLASAFYRVTALLPQEIKQGRIGTHLGSAHRTIQCHSNIHACSPSSSRMPRFARTDARCRR